MIYILDNFGVWENIQTNTVLSNVFKYYNWYTICKSCFYTQLILLVIFLALVIKFIFLIFKQLIQDIYIIKTMLYALCNNYIRTKYDFKSSTTNTKYYWWLIFGVGFMFFFASHEATTQFKGNDPTVFEIGPVTVPFNNKSKWRKRNLQARPSRNKVFKWKLRYTADSNSRCK